ncbi:MAG: 2OG-Fe(II) oxygenase [Janthinobacterium lividum]
MSDFLDEAVLTEFVRNPAAPATFTDRSPFPWSAFGDLLKPGAFRTLLDAFPSVELFEMHRGLERAHGQRSHDRFYLAYEQSIYERADRAPQEGVVGHDALPPAWQAFIDELNSSPAYREFTEKLLGVGPMSARFAWHMGVTGSEVSPHRDSVDKIGTHIFYFNTADDWQPEWGGSIVVLGGKRIAANNPDMSDFETAVDLDIRDNRSFLFKNTPDAWHGVEPLTCPSGSYRRLFNVILHPAEGRVAKPRGFLRRTLQSLRA